MTQAWLLASLGLLPAFTLAVLASAKGAAGSRFVAIQLAGSFAVFLFVMLDFAFGQPASVDLGLTLCLLGLPGILTFGLFLERWL